MPRYKQYEHLPWWLSCLDHHTLTPTEKETLNLDYFCKRHGTKLSHQAAANLLHRSRSWIVKCRRRLEVLGLRRTEPAKGSFKLGHPVEYPNEQAFFEQLERGRGSSRGVFKIPKYSGGLPPLWGGSPPSQSEPPPETTTEKESLPPQSPAGSTASVQGCSTARPASKSVRDECTWQIYYADAISHLRDTIKDPCRAERIARVTADNKLKNRGSPR